MRLAAPDGSRQTQLTKRGAYSSVSQAADGTMIRLVRGERLRTLSHTGQVLAEYPTFVSDGAPTPGPINCFHGPFDREISPDGRAFRHDESCGQRAGPRLNLPARRPVSRMEL